ncbi:MAG: hypothetical protein AAF970_18115 [Bacteroidota bacterium]
MPHRLFSLALVPVIVLAAATSWWPQAPSTDLDDYGVLLGTWVGHLDYLDGDDLTRERLATTMSCEKTYSPRHDEPVLTFSYNYDARLRVEARTDEFYIHGRTIERSSQLQLIGNTRIEVGERWEIAEHDLAPDRISLVLTREGEDNNRPASFRQLIVADADSLVMTEEVRYEGTSESFIRNTYRFSRQP